MFPGCFLHYSVLSSVHQLPRIDAVVISHSHYDHLDAGSVASLNARFGGELRWYVCWICCQRLCSKIHNLNKMKIKSPNVCCHRFVPLGLMDWLVKMGCENVMELDWWEENCVPGHDDVTFVCTPAQHWSKRTALDDNKVWIYYNYYNIVNLSICNLLVYLLSILFYLFCCSGWNIDLVNLVTNIN